VSVQILVILTSLVCFYPNFSFAGYGGMGLDDGDATGHITGWEVVGALIYFGGLFFYLTRSKDDSSAFLKLVAAVLFLIAITSLDKCMKT